MTIIELLNKIANGEEVPKKIKYIGLIWEYDTKIKDYIHNDIFLIYKMNSFALNKKVEILEEENNIEKIPYRNCENRNRQEVYYELVDDIFHKINDDILPAINKLKEDK